MDLIRAKSRFKWNTKWLPMLCNFCHQEYTITSFQWTLQRLTRIDMTIQQKLCWHWVQVLNNLQCYIYSYVLIWMSFQCHTTMRDWLMNLMSLNLVVSIGDHDDSTNWKRYPHLLALCEGIHRSPVYSYHKESVIRRFGTSVDVSLRKLLSWDAGEIRCFGRHLTSLLWYID